MSKLTLTQAQRLLLGIIASVENGSTTPEEAVVELNTLKADAVSSQVKFSTDYTIDDFRKIREVYVSQYESSVDPYPETSYESSESY